MKISFLNSRNGLVCPQKEKLRDTSCVLPSVLPFPAHPAWIWAISWENLVICATRRKKKKCNWGEKKDKMSESLCGNLALNSRKILEFILRWSRTPRAVGFQEFESMGWAGINKLEELYRVWKSHLKNKSWEAGDERRGLIPKKSLQWWICPRKLRWVPSHESVC